MRAAVVVALLSSFLITCPDTYAADRSNEPDLLIVLDHAKLTQWVLEDFPDGLPFDRSGVPTDAEQAQKFWQLLADWPISINGPVHGLPGTLDAISKETGLPIVFGKDAWDRLKDADAKMKMFTISDSVEKAVRIICRTAGVDKTVVTPGGLVVLGPDDPDAPEQLLAPKPANTFRWRADYEKLVEKALGEDWKPFAGTQDDYRQLMQIASEIRCDLVLEAPLALDGFIQWIAKESKQTIQIDLETIESASAKPRMTKPTVARFASFLDAVNAALDGTGIEMIIEETHFRVVVKEELEKSGAE